MSELPDHISIKAACRLIGGDKPIHPATYYRGARAGIYPAPFHPSPGISRVILLDLIAALRARRAAERAEEIPE
jgi:hypothetical protein